MQLVAVGINHTSASVSLRERLTIPADALLRALGGLRESVAEVLALSTCNRVELYAVCGHEATGADLLRQFLAANGDVPLRTCGTRRTPTDTRPPPATCFASRPGSIPWSSAKTKFSGRCDARSSPRATRERLGPVLDRLGDAALACGKRTRASTSLGRDGDSVASVAVRLAAREIGIFENAQVVVLGAGETARSALAQLAAVAATRVTVLNRTYHRALELAATHLVRRRVRWRELADALASADVVFGCTGSPTTVIDSAMLRRVRRGDDRAVLCVDLGLPRDIDPAVASMPGVTLIDLDRLELETAGTLAADRARDLVRAESIVEQETERYMEWWRGAVSHDDRATPRSRRCDSATRSSSVRSRGFPSSTPQSRAVVRRSRSCA